MGISVATRKVLWTRAHNMCAFPSCRQQLTIDETDATTGRSFETVVGQEAHVRSAQLNGPRHDPNYPTELLDEYENLILLCPTHHTMIDAHNGAGYTVDDVLSMRSTHEQQLERKDSIYKAALRYVAEQYTVDDRVLFEQVDLHGPSVDAMFVDVPIGCREDVSVAELMDQISTERPGDPEATDDGDGWVVTGAAQALLHPDWMESALLVGGPGQGKSTLLQYICQFYRSRLLDKDGYRGDAQSLAEITTVRRVPIRIDLRKYAHWANVHVDDNGRAKRSRKKKQLQRPTWGSIEQYIVAEMKQRNGGFQFTLEDFALLVSTEPILIALDGLDEVANLDRRSRVSEEIVSTHARLKADAAGLVILVATRPGATTSALWSSQDFPTLYLRRLSQGLRLQYLQQWTRVAKLSQPAADRLQKTFMDNQHVPHIRELASYPMQLAILLHLLYRRQLLPQQRTDLYREYLKTFLDREQTEDKEPLLGEQRQVIEDIHAFLAWHLQCKSEEGVSEGSIARGELKRLLRRHLAGREDGLKLTEQLFSAISTRVLCLVERDTGTFQFEVQSLREYFAALYIFENAPTKGAGCSRDDCLNALLERPYWSNVCRFFVGMFSKVEVRGIRQNLREISARGDFGKHPLLRSTAALFLDDRTYEGQADEPIQEVVDFILDGPGVVFAEDGLLDVSGSALRLSERAGQVQAVRHVQRRLPTEESAVMRGVLASCLRRHAAAVDDISAWWWSQPDLTPSWLETAARIRVLGSLGGQQTARLAALLEDFESDSTWATELLVLGGYNGSAESVLRICMTEINAGASDAPITLDSSTPACDLLEVAAAAQLRPSQGATRVHRPEATESRIRRRRNGSGRPLEAIAASRDFLRNRPDASSTFQDWRTRLVRIFHAWGDGWVLRRSASTLPQNCDLPTMIESVRASDPELAAVLLLESDARANRADTDWWQQRLLASETRLDLMHWIYSLLTVARPHVVTALATELNDRVDQLPTKYFVAVRESTRAFMVGSTVRRLVLQDPLRLKHVKFSPRVLWLLRVAGSDGTIEQIDTRIAEGFETLLRAGMGDMRELLRAAGASRVVKVDLLREGRMVLPAGGWASDIKMGAIRPQLAELIVRTPENWPSDVVQRAVELIAGRMLKPLRPLSSVAAADNWFSQE